MNSYKNLLINDERFRLEDGLFYQKDFGRHNAFEEAYLQLRQKEGRVYTDETVRMLPEFQGQPALTTEWKIRKKSIQRLTHYLTKRRPSHIIEIGCGNGWLINSLQKQVAAAYCGIDINEPELQQAARVFGTTSSAFFLYGDILSGAMNGLRADAIIVASAAQYFSQLNYFIDQLIALLTPNGEIHIIDTPFYTEAEIENAKRRSEQYFTDAGVNAEQRHYYHHSWKSLQSFHYRIEYEPTGFFHQLKKQFSHDSPFPWIVIAKKDSHG